MVHTRDQSHQALRKSWRVITNHVFQRTRTFICCMGILVCGEVWLGPGPSYPGTDGTPLSSGVMPAIPSLDSIPSTPAGDSIRLGYNLIVNTQTYAKTFVGNALSCTNCHLDAGRKVGAGTYVGVLYAYPQYKARVGKEISLGDRINECFERSLNGKALPPHSPETEAIQAYMSWLSQNVPPSADLSWLGFPLMTMTRKPDKQHGQYVFANSCAGCHGPDGQGTMVAPPLWGPRSFNIASGLARLSKAAGFIKTTMPFNRPGTLLDADAYDVAAFMNSHSRPDYALKAFDWPKGGKPADSPY
ncbi:MAG: c-type cytochrome [Nitrospira sp.]|nr:c-type cytochrome [Nitrospira sp.]MCA9456929.1 c-type cytochrome [Nitrospira sp.]MCW5782927.1 c-type cytochrome [Nitrospirales bacterium]